MNNEINSLPSHYASLLRIQLAAMLCVCIALIPILTSTNFVFGEAPTDTAALYIITFYKGLYSIKVPHFLCMINAVAI